MLSNLFVIDCRSHGTINRLCMKGMLEMCLFPYELGQFQNPFSQGSNVRPAIGQDGWRHILKKHVCQSEGPWELLNFPNDCQAICRGVSNPAALRSEATRQAVEQFGNHLQASLNGNGPLVVRYKRSVVNSKERPKWTWLVLLPWGASAYLRFNDHGGAEQGGSVITCFFRDGIVQWFQANENQTDENRVVVERIAIRWILETYAIQEGQQWRRPGKRHAITRRNEQINGYVRETNIRFSPPPANWGFAADA